MQVQCFERLTQESVAKSGLPFSSKHSTQRVQHHHGVLTWKTYIKIQSSQSQMSQFGVNLTAYGQDRHWRCSQLILDGCIFLLTPFLSTTYSQDYKVSSQAISIPMQMTLKDQCHTGCMSTHMARHGNFLRQWPGGSDGMTELMLCLPINLKLVGITYLKEEWTITRVPQQVNIHQNTCIITICTQRSMNFQGRREARKQLQVGNSYQSDSFPQVSDCQ